MTERVADSAWTETRYAINGFSQFCRAWTPSRPDTLPVIALHGSLAQSGMWITLAESADSMPMLCPDQRGFGLSDDPGSDSCEAFASDALALAREALPARFVVVAHSFACSIALEAACRARDSVIAVVLVDPVIPPKVKPPAARLTTPETFESLDAAERYFRETEEGQWPEDTLRRYLTDVLIRDGGGAWRQPYSLQRLQRLRDFTASPQSDFDLFAKAGRVRCPVLAFRGGISKRFPAASEQTFIEAFSSPPEIVVCPISGHFPTATELDIVVPALKRFLQSCAR